ncbi:4465294a-50e7-4f91-bdd7-ab3950458f3a [Thermothielavioides terrestris]|uniref:4465294a-50e7-4f91-bdd7-ab3950458f3a n=1 Tax=Thermothielavioides terrestris TaxID=2587410 RepID=A0A3S4AN90_9PEZI|nr:4465294a-50e7-4f91-bdd7-ab3950458f3a [Thermothielavioides terrestris]
MTSLHSPPAQLAQALVDFSVHGSFPEDEVSSLPLDAESLSAAIKALADAKAKLRAEIHAINEETADDVRAWQANAQSVQDDILRSKALAADIVKAAEAPVVSGSAVQEIEARADFLIRELNYNAQVHEALKGIKTVNRTLDEVEQARDERRILDALHLLERSWKELDAVGASKSCRAIKLLDIRAFELKSDVHEVFDHVWNALISVDVENHRVSINSTREDEPMSLEDAVIGLKAYKEVDQRMSRLWQNIHQAILLPRMDFAAETLPGIHTENLVANGATVSVDDHSWDAWDDEEQGGAEEAANSGADKAQEEGEDDGLDAWGWGEDEAAPEEPNEKPKDEPQESKADDEDDPSAAWGWGDEGDNDEVEGPAQTQAAPRGGPQTRELVLKEMYSISSVPQPVLDLIFSVFEDGAALTQETHAGSPVATQAAGLYLYNDSTYMAERLSEFAAAWKQREDISPRAQNMLRLENDIKSLQSFANRTYTNELAIQKTVLRDLLGGEQNLLQQPDTAAAVSAATGRVRALATAWEAVLARSVWQQAVGALVDAVAAKMVADVMDLPAIGQDEAYSIAGLIASAEELDELFLPSRLARHGAGEGEGVGKGVQGQEKKKGKEEVEAEEVPLTAQFAGSWLRLKYLSEVLQSNLRDVRFLWMEGELSLYFTAEEVVDLVKASFEDNARTREVIREIRANLRPLE